MIPFTEDDVSVLLQKYNPQTVLTLLQELANYPHSKFDWNDLVARTSTGISNAREYQMLWHHLAYGHSFPQDFEDDQPMNDDSDLECERETLPRPNKEIAAEASACVQVMMSSFKLSESTPTSSVIEAPLTINVPVCHSSRIPEMDSSQPSCLGTQETKVIFPVTVKRQALPNVAKAVEARGAVIGNTSMKRKRDPWSEEEDLQLRAAVQRWGEGNWASMAKSEDFTINRSTSQLSKRWSTLRKKRDDNK